jgi:hypothetical protein
MDESCGMEKMKAKLISVNPIGHSSWAAVFLGFLISFLFLLLPFYSAADVYRYIDENGITHLTNIPMGPRFKVLFGKGGQGFSTAPDAEPAPVLSLAPFDALIAGAAKKYGVDSSLVRAIIRAESNFDHRAVSKKGARGLMQLMPETALALGVGDCFHPEDNIDGGIRHLSRLIGLYNGDLRLALAAYNAGEGAVTRYSGIPPFSETRSYVREVLGHYARYRKESTIATAASASMKQSRSGQRHLSSLQ